jgi:hypothetical protein
MGRAATTVAAGLRNAARSHTIYKWVSDLVPDALTNYEVIMRNNVVTIWHKASKATALAMSNIVLSVTTPSPAVLTALLTLIEANIIDRVIISDIDPMVVHQIAVCYDVAVVELASRQVQIV